MGAVLSLPVSLAASAGSHLACCCASSTCSCLGAITSSSHKATRIAWALFFLFGAACSWVMYTPAVYNYFHARIPDPLRPSCDSCYGVLAVHRTAFSLAAIHLFFSVFSIAIASASDPRMKLNNGFWGLKLLAWVALAIGAFFIPDGFFLFYSKFIATAAAALFILTQLVLFVDFAHVYAENLLDKRDESTSRWASLALVLTTLVMVCGVATMCILMFVNGSTIVANAAAAFPAVNLVLSFLVCVLSVMPCVQECNPRSGLVQASIVSFYATSLVFSALGFGSRTGEGLAGTLMSAAFTIASIVYSTTNTASKTSVLQPSEEDGGLEDSLDYRPWAFHAIFACAAAYAALTITSWQYAEPTGAMPTSITAGAWVKITTGWLSFLLYIWTLMGPVLLPDRYW